jgi:hypothetical protein
MGSPNTAASASNENQQAQAEPSKVKGSKASRFGVYQFETGSYEFGQHKFLPSTIVEIPVELELPVEEEDSPVVKVYPTRQLAEANLARLKANFDAKKGKV